MTERANRLAIAICGAGHSGSTLLGFVLGSHSRCFYAGEARKSVFIRDPARPLRKRVCKLCGDDSCPVWGRVATPPQPDLYEVLSALSGRPAIVDSSKRVGWIRERAAELDRAGVPHKRIFLGRDGRAVVNSRWRKDPQADVAALTQAWVAQIEATRALLAERPADWLAVRYEALATEPEPTVRGICAFLGLPFEESMLEYHTFAHHPLGGNAGTQSMLATGRVRPTTSDPAFYAGRSGGFRLDLRWRTELPRDAQAVFEAIAGEVNQPFRWDGEEPA